MQKKRQSFPQYENPAPGRVFISCIVSYAVLLMAVHGDPSARSSRKDLSRQFQFFLRREGLVKFFHVRIVHIIALRRLIHACDVI